MHHLINSISSLVLRNVLLVLLRMQLIHVPRKEEKFDYPGFFVVLPSYCPYVSLLLLYYILPSSKNAAGIL